MKRVILFLATNLAILLVLNVTLRLLGVERILDSRGIGLARRERTLARLQATLDAHARQPATFACTLVPRKAPGQKRAGCG